MKIKFEREEVEKIVTDFAIKKFSLTLSGKQYTISGYYGGIEIEITDKREEENEHSSKDQQG